MNVDIKKKQPASGQKEGPSTVSLKKTSTFFKKSFFPASLRPKTSLSKVSSLRPKTARIKARD